MWAWGTRIQTVSVTPGQVFILYRSLMCPKAQGSCSRDPSSLKYPVLMKTCTQDFELIPPI